MQEEGAQNKLYIGNLDYSVTEEDLRQAFSEKGMKPKDVRVIKDKFSGRSKGFGFAELETQEQVGQAISNLDGVDLKGRKLRVSQARERKPRSDF